MRASPRSRRGKWPSRTSRSARTPGRRARRSSRAYMNQLELPTLFYGVVALAAAMQMVDRTFVALEWAFVVSRLGHAAIHVTANNVLRRFQAFLVGAVVLMGLWFWLALKVFAGL
ncbi:MAG: MAPEG family protein [Rhodoblastus sp.]|nr:MAG: MAPEG family protein [Rhodoblastus sp.]